MHVKHGNQTKKEMKKLNQVLDKIIRRVLMTPDSTPREALYIETGMLDIETTMDLKRMYMMARLKRNSSEMMDQVLANPQCKWMNKTKEVLSKYNIFTWELAGTEEDKKIINHMILERTKSEFHKRINNIIEGKSKMAHLMEGKKEWEPGKTPEYMNELTRKQASVIF